MWLKNNKLSFSFKGKDSDKDNDDEYAFKGDITGLTFKIRRKYTVHFNSNIPLWELAVVTINLISQYCHVTLGERWQFINRIVCCGVIHLCVQEGITKIHVFFDEVIANRHRVTLEGRGGGGGGKKKKKKRHLFCVCTHGVNEILFLLFADNSSHSKTIRQDPDLEVNTLTAHKIFT